MGNLDKIQYIHFALQELGNHFLKAEGFRCPEAEQAIEYAEDLREFLQDVK